MGLPTGRTFVIRTIVDLLAVPAHRRGQCLSELQGWLAHVDAHALTVGPSGAARVSCGPYIWTDDGVGGVQTDARVVDGDRLIVGPGYLDRNPNDSRLRFRDMTVSEQHARQGRP